MTSILSMQNITKQFPGVLANDEICLTIKKGEVHTLLGENGAGKTTLMNILCGLHRPTSGQIFLDEMEVCFSCAKDAQTKGIGMVHQHFMLIPTLSVVENCLIGAKSRSPFRIDIKGAARQILELAEQYQLDVDPYAVVGDLSVGQMQRAEIIKALMRGTRILILDEPTSVLTPQEAQQLFHMIHNLTADGYTVLFISHKLKEVKEISDRITVLRQGRHVTTIDNTDACGVNELARLMVGREVDFSIHKKEQPSGRVVLDVQGLRMKQKYGGHEYTLLDDVSLQVHEGEILGIAGVDGNGQNELVRCLTGLHKASGGHAIYDGLDLTELTTRQIMAKGVSHVPQDRQSSGLILSMNIVENMILQDYYKPGFGKRGGFLNWKHINAYTIDNIRNFNVKTPGRFELVKNLSGGNQQKVIIAREMSRSPRLLIAMHPTRGLDVGANEYIHKRLLEERSKGVAILLVSTELEEVMKLSDRVCVMYDGRIMGTVNPRELDEETVGLMMGGTPYDQLESVRKTTA